MDAHTHPSNHHDLNLQKDILASFFSTPSSTMQQDHLQQQTSSSMTFQPSSGSAPSSQSTNVSLSPMSNLQNQLSMNMFNNMIQIQNLNDQLVGMAGQGQQSTNPSSVQYNPQALFVEQQFKLNQLQQLQQLQNQIFQQQIALISGQPTFLSTSSPISRPDMLSNSLPISSLKDTNSASNNAPSSYAGLPTPGPSSELRPRDGTIEFVSPMILNSNSFMDSPISPQSTHPNDNPYSHSHQPPGLHSQPQHYNTAPPQIAFQIQSNLSSHPASPVFNSGNGTPSSVLSNASVMPGGDLDLSPITSPWLGAASSRHQHSQQATEPGMSLHRSASFSHHLPPSVRLKRPAGNDMIDQSHTTADARANDSETSGPLRKKPVLASPSTTSRHDHSQQQAHPQSTPLTIISQSPESPLMSPTSPFSTSTNLVSGGGTPAHNMGSAGSAGLQRRGFRDRVSKSVTSTPLLRGQRARVGSITRAANGPSTNVSPGSTTLSPHAFGGKGTSSSKTNTPSTSTIGTGLPMVGFDVVDTPSPVDLDLSMPPPAPPEQINSHPGSSSTMRSSGSKSGSGIRSSPNLGPGMMGFEGLSGDHLLPATPASIMNLTHNAPGTGNSEKGQLEAIQIVDQQSFSGSSSQDKKTQDLDQERNAKIKRSGDKEKEVSGKAKGNTANAVSSIATSRSRRNAAILPGSTGIGSGLKAILPANPPDANSIPPNTSSRIEQQIQQQPRKTSHKAAEQKRRDSLKSTFDDLRTLLPPIPLPSEIDESAGTAGGVIPGIPGAWPPRSSSQLPGSLPPRGPPKTGTEGPNKGVSKLQLLICGNEYIRVLRARVERRDVEIERLRNEVSKLRILLADQKPAETEAGEKDADIEMFGVDVGFDSDLDLERDLDAVEIRTRDGANGGMGWTGGGFGVGTGAANVSILDSVGEQPDEEDDGE